ncbi:hypothetical protein M378DRAFT_331652 [Amanita muscaria Koide BX008]|uniref:Uncharacterized protein n=1 Tax=Amanita muscaria (strain Koide BX008) TaxID=946122 RepID=A0A0C2WZB6_AMAMK|nr:hypothetical protein M378DRAFT_331652 [Amanita muscaria Koide BX008]
MGVHSMANPNFGTGHIWEVLLSSVPVCVFGYTIGHVLKAPWPTRFLHLFDPHTHLIKKRHGPLVSALV